MRTEIKAAPAVFELEELDAETGTIAGYGSTFGGEPDSYGDVIAEGAFAKSLAAHKAAGTQPKMFWQHDPSQPIGGWSEMKEDDRGLFVRGRLNMNVQRGREAYELLKDRNIDGLSIGYRVVEFTINTDEEIWTLTEVELREVSVVSMPANGLATVSEIKAARRCQEITGKLAAGDRLTEREFEQLLKGTLGLSNSQAERAARIHLKRQGDPADADEGAAFLRALMAS